MSLILYYAPQTRALRTIWALEELGVPYEKVHLDLKAGDQKKPEYLALNPNGKVPTLVVDGAPMFETLAISLYLAEHFGVERGLWPKEGDAARREALTWMAWEQATLQTNLIRFIDAGHELIPKERHNAAAQAAARADVERDFAILDAHLAKSAFVAGDAFTFADMGLAFGAMFAGRCGFDLARWPHVAAWSAKATSRPAFVRAMAG